MVLRDAHAALASAARLLEVEALELWIFAARSCCSWSSRDLGPGHQVAYLPPARGPGFFFPSGLVSLGLAPIYLVRLDWHGWVCLAEHCSLQIPLPLPAGARA